MDKLGLDFEKCKILFKKSSPQVSEFFSVCLVRPTCTHCRRHWTRRGSPKGDRKIIRTLILQRYVWYGLVVEMTKTINFSIWALNLTYLSTWPLLCVWAQNWKYCKSVNKIWQKTVKVGLNCEIIGFLLFLRISPIQGVLTINTCFKISRILWTLSCYFGDGVEMTRPFQVYFGIVLIKDILYQAQISFWKVEK